MENSPTILFSTTTQFNPGDEVILLGIERLLAAKNIHYQRRIYDRNPAHKHQREIALDPAKTVLPDYIIFAGTPEWNSEFPNLRDLWRGPHTPRFFARTLRLRQTDRTNDPLLRYILDHNIRCAFLGVGSSKPPVPTHKIDRILREQADVFIVRDRQTYSIFKDYQPIQAHCPAFFCAADDTPRQALHRIGVTLQAPHSSLIRMSSAGLSTAYEAYKTVQQYFPQTEIICHTQGDAAFVAKAFPQAIIHTARTGAELIETYRQFDAILATRLHGCITACALGLPTFQLWHGLRMEALRAFPLANQNGELSALEWVRHLDVSSQSQYILETKRKAWEKYLGELDKLSLFDTSVRYGE